MPLSRSGRCAFVTVSRLRLFSIVDLPYCCKHHLQVFSLSLSVCLDSSYIIGWKSFDVVKHLPNHWQMTCNSFANWLSEISTASEICNIFCFFFFWRLTLFWWEACLLNIWNTFWTSAPKEFDVKYEYLSLKSMKILQRKVKVQH